MVLSLLSARAVFLLTSSIIRIARPTVLRIRGMFLGLARPVTPGVLIVSKATVSSAIQTIFWSLKPINAPLFVLPRPLSSRTPKSSRPIFILPFTAFLATQIASPALDQTRTSVMFATLGFCTTKDSTNVPLTASMGTLMTPITPLNASSAWKTVSVANKACFCMKATATSFALSALRLLTGPTFARPR